MRAFAGQQQAIAEYAPVKAVLVSETLVRVYGWDAFLRKLFDAGIERLYVSLAEKSDPFGHDQGKKDVIAALGPLADKAEFIANSSGGTGLWTRDWGPVLARTRDGQARILDFNYSRQWPDAFNRLVSANGARLPRISVPLRFEGGNFMITGRGDCALSRKVVAQNAVAKEPGDIVFDEVQIVELMKAFAGCRRVHLTPSLPGELTEHIDLWAKFTSDEDVLVGEISQRRLESFAAGQDAAQVARFLDEQAQAFQSLGFRVHRIPMPLPRGRVFRSYVNALLVNGTAFVPRYGILIRPGAGQENYHKEYAAEVESAYRGLGFKVEWVDSDDTIPQGGAVHCVTMQLAELL